MYCFDTNVIIDLFHGDKRVQEKLRMHSKEEREFFITPISLCELYKGSYLFFNPQQGAEQVDALLTSFTLLEFDGESCKEFGRLYAQLKKNGRMTQEFDLMIAAIAKVNNLTLITRNKRHFEHTGVALEVW